MARSAEAHDPTPRVVVVEDEPDIGTLLEYALVREGFAVTVARNGEEAITALDHDDPDVVTLDLMLPDMTGLDLLRRIRSGSRQGRPRVIILSARKDEADRLQGFELGADDYVVKPFSPRELVFRIRTVLGRGAPVEAGAPPALVAGPISINEERHETRVSGELVQLTLTEFRLLADMVRHQGRVRSRETLLSRVWDYDSEAMSRTVDTHIRRLRAKLGPAAAWIATVRGVGYRIQDPASH
jgi:two-component system phosphate regulon response regulator PhoB